MPVVRRTGGLNDTVFDVDHDAERAAAAAFPTNGFSFEGTDAAGIDYALNRRGASSVAVRQPQWSSCAGRGAHGEQRHAPELALTSMQRPWLGAARAHPGGAVGGSHRNNVLTVPGVGKGSPSSGPLVRHHPCVRACGGADAGWAAAQGALGMVQRPGVLGGAGPAHHGAGLELVRTLLGHHALV